MLYQKPWMAQLFNLYGIGIIYEDSVNTLNDRYIPVLKHDLYGPHTGEEIRYMIGNSITHGAKGIIFDGTMTYKFPLINSGGKDAEIGEMRWGGLFNMGWELITDTHVDYDKTGEDFLTQELFGHDYLEYNGDYSNIPPYIRFDLLNQYVACQDNSFYVGRKSARMESYKMFTYIKHNGDELLKLDLQANYFKGFKEHYLQHHDITQDTILKNFINFDSSAFHLYKLADVLYGDSASAPQEPFIDSTYFELTLLKDRNRSLDSVFYIGLVNRRTDPMIVYKNPTNPEDKYLRFIPTYRLDSLCRNGGEGQSAEYWQGYYYKRLGSREFELPFNFIHSTDTASYHLLKVTELGTDITALDTLWYLNAPYNHKIKDTVIGQDRPLKIRMLPGQSKILKVEVLKPDFVEGHLDNYNQSKMIEFQDPTDTNQIRYHLTYYRQDSVITSHHPVPVYKVINQVYYVQSEAIEKNSITENIVWQIPQVVSQGYINLSEQPVTNRSCDFPSIVVRKDTTDSSLTKAYIVYTCEGNDPEAPTSELVETVINTEPAVPLLLSSRVISEFKGFDHSRFGTPVINASSNGNYLAWSDSSNGLVIAFHTPNENFPNQFQRDTIRRNIFNPFCNAFDLLYPSLNVYSSIENNEDNCALVWYQECPEDAENIFYTRLFYDSTSGIKYDIHNVYHGLYPPLHNPSVTAIRLSDNIDNESIPVVYRSLADYSQTVDTCYNRYDVIYWVKNENDSNQYIQSRVIYHNDSLNIPIKWSSTGVINRYFNPDLVVMVNSIYPAQQDGLSLSGGQEVSFPHGDLNLNATLNNESIYQFADYIQPNYRTSKIKWNFVSYGKNTHLSNSTKPNLHQNHQAWKNRRVYEKHSDTINPEILSSAKLFYRIDDADELKEDYLIGFQGDLNEALVGAFEVNQDIVPPWMPKDQCTGGYYFEPKRDTILTEYFYINTWDDNVPVSMIYSGVRDSNLVRLYLERGSDSSLTELPLPLISPPNHGILLNFDLVNGGGDEYRFVFISNDTTSVIKEESYVGGIPLIDTIYAKSTSDNRIIIDLSTGSSHYANNDTTITIEIYPNPVVSELNISGLLPYNYIKKYGINSLIHFEIYDAIGNLQFEFNSKSGKVESFDLSSFSSGLYTVIAQHTGKDRTYRTLSKFIVN